LTQAIATFHAAAAAQCYIDVAYSEPGGWQVTISTHNYNTARNLLIAAGSLSAKKSHPKHGGDAWPDGHGQSLLREARDEFNIWPEPARSQGRAVVVAAGAQMGIANW
jgi:hypothetical protein